MCSSISSSVVLLNKRWRAQIKAALGLESLQKQANCFTTEDKTILLDVITEEKTCPVKKQSGPATGTPPTGTPPTGTPPTGTPATGTPATGTPPTGTPPTGTPPTGTPPTGTPPTGTPPTGSPGSRSMEVVSPDLSTKCFVYKGTGNDLSEIYIRFNKKTSGKFLFRIHLGWDGAQLYTDILENFTAEWDGERVFIYSSDWAYQMRFGYNSIESTLRATEWGGSVGFQSAFPLNVVLRENCGDTYWILE